jgi:hypothetical protein
MVIEFLCWYAANVVADKRVENFRLGMKKLQDGVGGADEFNNNFLNVEVNFDILYYQEYLGQMLLRYSVLNLAVPYNAENSQKEQPAIASASVFLENAYKNKGPLKDMGYDEIVARLEDCVVASNSGEEGLASLLPWKNQTFGGQYAAEALFYVRRK